MHIKTMGVGMDEPQAIKPIDVGLRYIDDIAAIRRERGIAAFCQPTRYVRGVPQRVQHHRVMIALQGYQAEPFTNACEQPIDHALALRPLIDIVAKRDDDARSAMRSRG